MSLAQRVRDYRYSKGWGPDDLASRAEISRTALYQIESGRTELPRAATLRRIAQALEVPIEVLLGSPGSAAPRAVAYGRGAGYPDPYRRARDVADELAFAAPEAPPQSREEILERKLRDLLRSPLGDSVGRIVEEAYRMLPMRPLPPVE